MKKKSQRSFIVASCLIVLFILWTVAISYVDVQAIGPRESLVGFATINDFFHKLTGVNMSIYIITDWLGLVPLCFIVGFAALGLIQLIKRKSILKVDKDILLLGGFYIFVMAVYVFFEIFVINYRPVLIDGYLEASYPSSTTMLVMCVIPTAVLQLNNRIKNRKIAEFVAIILMVFTAFMVIGRFISGVHWITDIIGGLLLSTGLVMAYFSAYKLTKSQGGNL